MAIINYLLPKLRNRAILPVTVLSLMAALTLSGCSGASTGNPQQANKKQNTFAKWNPGHYIHLGFTGELTDELVLTPGFRGVQKVYFWKTLEPEMDKYDFSTIEKDLEILTRNNKQLFLQLQWKSFKPGITYAPDYIAQNPDYMFFTEVFTKENPPYNPRIWNPFVLGRFNKLISELGKVFDSHPNFEGINLPESAPSATPTELARTGYYPVDADGKPELNGEKAVFYLTSNMLAMKEAFPLSVKIQYMNFPVFLFTENKVHEILLENGIGMGGPDVSDRPNLNNGVYRYYPPLSGKVPLGSAVQSPDYDWDGVHMKVETLYHIGKDQLKLNHMFWGIREPWWGEVKKMVAGLTQSDPAGGLDSVPPLSIKTRIAY